MQLRKDSELSRYHSKVTYISDHCGYKISIKIEGVNAKPFKI